MVDPVSVAGLGLAVFSTGAEYGNSGNFSSTSKAVSYMHPKTPNSARWRDMNTRIKLTAFHPRPGWSRQVFYFRLIYQYNGYDIRNARVEGLVDASSGMYTSSFTVNWRGQSHSRQSNPVSQIVFNFVGRWDPHGLGDVSFGGQLVISASLNGSAYESFGMDFSERNWVRAGY
ncbi:hypothetical protein KOR42_55020 [Thalassoglobus neptunius]|uniref:Uncharacterized protein n=1 Tax=Thalassoglobus neptunius TaxID=1938619 RepID=A0A5C5UWE2_9PLAN|nr:hypothetical protein [Thalassoglobus neptunius]TWT29742.1 hypothetical protein KOR42_55020 [Thalassoglobus neptunius]